ncbi:uncharacterized protein ANIA_11615 [Aspergillus nidulans FGSC A4]|uniref:Uncharacterized protein n=1 Tax=Emericella nidulans (strain FGSC A4 / ATCC 38163 / CBS 112.46 / NRRL 194 / M139) TaxID=227321 RepID=C8VEJ8_EMENI|nr:hypothetical protein [Aspergillus nidulans FGSC A4]CBF80647.1 TPA: hypothetical protein ANIA_11615 [Aspergillus nidulans FGSC A4]
MAPEVMVALSDRLPATFESRAKNWEKDPTDIASIAASEAAGAQFRKMALPGSAS